MRSSKGRAALAALFASVALMSLAPSALANYTHTWACTWAAYSQCWDYAGQTYNPWERVRNATGVRVYEVCAKARTAAGNTRTGSGCAYQNVDYRMSNIAGAYPESAAYIYWGSCCGQVQTSGLALTYD